MIRRAAIVAALAAACTPPPAADLVGGGETLGEVGPASHGPIPTADHEALIGGSLADPSDDEASQTTMPIPTTTLPPPATTWHVHIAGVVDTEWWTEVARCESELNPRAYSSVGPFYGGLQWLMSTWRAAGGTGDPRDASLAQEYARAQHWITQAPWRTQWPTCGPRAYRVLGRGPR